MLDDGGPLRAVRRTNRRRTDHREDRGCSASRPGRGGIPPRPQPGHPARFPLPPRHPQSGGGPALRGTGIHERLQSGGRHRSLVRGGRPLGASLLSRRACRRRRRPRPWRRRSPTTSGRSTTRAATPAPWATWTGPPNPILSVVSRARRCCPSTSSPPGTSLVTSQRSFVGNIPPAPLDRRWVSQLLSRFAGAVGLETGRRRALVTAGQPVEREPPSHRGLPHCGSHRGAAPDRRPSITTRPTSTRSNGGRTCRTRPGRALAEQLPPGERARRSHFHPLARGLEVRRAGVPLLSPRRRTRHRRRSPWPRQGSAGRRGCSKA